MAVLLAAATFAQYRERHADITTWEPWEEPEKTVTKERESRATLSERAVSFAEHTKESVMGVMNDIHFDELLSRVPVAGESLYQQSVDSIINGEKEEIDCEENTEGVDETVGF